MGQPSFLRLVSSTLVLCAIRGVNGANWGYSYPTGAEQRATSIASLSNNEFVVGGYNKASNGLARGVIGKFDSAGNSL